MGLAQVAVVVFLGGGEQGLHGTFGSVPCVSHVSMPERTWHVQKMVESSTHRRSLYYDELKVTSGQVRGASVQGLSSGLALTGSHKGLSGETPGLGYALAGNAAAAKPKHIPSLLLSCPVLRSAGSLQPSCLDNFPL